MNLLLDTHTLIWAFDANPKLSQVARDAISEGQNEVFVSAVTAWEIAIKRAELLQKGIEGKNTETRDATLRLKLFDDHTELLGLEVTLNEARRDLEQDRLSWDCLRYKLRLLEVQRVLEGVA